jgi:hypothetical protein
MQTLIKKSKFAACLKAFPEDRRHFGANSQPVNIKSASVNKNVTPDQPNIEEGLILVKEGEGVFYIRYDIIFAKAGDILFMPRRVPKDFKLDTDQVITLKENPEEFEKFFNASFVSNLS